MSNPTEDKETKPQGGELPNQDVANASPGEEKPDSAMVEKEEFAQLYAESLKNITEGEVIKGKVMALTSTDVIVDIGFKSDGIIPLVEFPEAERPEVGQEIDVYLESIENQDGQVVLSKEKADFLKVWDTIKENFDTQAVLSGKILRKIKGGLVVDLLGVEAFLPGSQIGLRKIMDMDSLVGQALAVKIIKLNKRRRNIVISHRIVLEEQREKQRGVLFAELDKGQVREGVVKNITDFGAFIDLGGIDGLLHITDMSWGRTSHPSEIVSIGDRMKVKILEFDRERQRVSLGLKQLTPHPWENIEANYPVGTKARGKIVSITNYGAFVELEKGVEGLIHISEMSWTRAVKHPSKIVAIGDSVEVAVLKVDKENEKISLGLKQLEPDPWLSIEERYPIGSRVTGRVRNIANFGVFVELEEGVDGLVHISDLTWIRRVKHPAEIVKKGDQVEVVVLNIDKEGRRISLGLKQARPNPWEKVDKLFPVNKILEAKVTSAGERGLNVDLPEGLEGYVPSSETEREEGKKLDQTFPVGTPIKVKVLRTDPANLRVVLSQKACSEEAKEVVEATPFIAEQQQPVTPVGEVTKVPEPETPKPEAES